MSVDEPRRISLLTGAGFSKALFEEMPIIDELTTAVLADASIKQSIEQAKVDPDRFAPQKQIRNIETWLQVIEESAAYVGDYVLSLQRKALVLTIERKIVEIISELGGQVKFAPEQIDDLRFIIKSNINILTTNYDLLIESATQRLIKTGTIAIESPYDLNAGLFDLGHMRNNVAFFASDDSAKATLSRYFKLHGSCDWYSFDASKDDKMYIDTTKLPNFLPAELLAETRENLNNMMPVIAPPTSSKRQQIHSFALKRIWLSAYSALNESTALILFGTALHETDGSLNALLIEGVPANIPIYIFDKDPKSVKIRAQKLFDSSRIELFEEPTLAKLRGIIEELQSTANI